MKLVDLAPCSVEPSGLKSNADGTYSVTADWIVSNQACLDALESLTLCLSSPDFLTNPQ